MNLPVQFSPAETEEAALLSALHLGFIPTLFENKHLSSQSKSNTDQSSVVTPLHLLM